MDTEEIVHRITQRVFLRVIINNFPVRYFLIFRRNDVRDETPTTLFDYWKRKFGKSVLKGRPDHMK